MIKTKNWYLIFLICGILSILNFLRLDIKLEKSLPSQHQEVAEQVNTFIQTQFDENPLIYGNLSKTHTPPKGWDLLKYENGKLVYWTDNEWLPDSSLFKRPGPQIQKRNNSLHLVNSKTNGSTFFLHKLIQKKGEGSFSQVQKLKVLENWDYEITTKESPYPIENSNLYLQFYGKPYQSKASNWFLAGLTLILLSFLWSVPRNLKGLLLSSGTLFLVRMLAIKGWLIKGVDHFPIFDPLIYANSELLPSLGDLGLHILVVLTLVYTFSRFLKSKKDEARDYKVNFYFIGALLAFFLTDLLLSIIKSLVLDSKLSFNVTELSSLTWFSFLAFVFIGLMFLAFYILISTLWKQDKTRNRRIEWAWMNTAIALILFVAFQWFDAGRSFSSMLPPIVLALIFLGILEAAGSSKRVYRYLFFIFFFSSLYTYSIFKHQMQRQSEYLNIYASKLLTNKDLEAEYLFRAMENKLTEEFLQPEDFESFSEKKDQFEKRLRRLYFSGYLDKYDMKVLSFDSLGNNINSSTLYNHEDLDEIYNFNSFPTLSNHFYQIKSTEILNGYLAKFENCDLNGHYGNIFILLEPKFIQSSYSYHKLVNRKRDNRLFDPDNYSYAIYNKSKLLHQKGYYSYDLKFDSTLFASNSKWDWRTFTHFIHQHDEQVNVVLSVKNDSLIRALSTFTFAFLFFLLLLVVMGLGMFSFEWVNALLIRRNKGKEAFLSYQVQRDDRWAAIGLDQMYLSTRIRFAMVGLVFAGLLISLYVTLQYINYSDSNQARRELMFKVREVANQIQNEIDLESKLDNEEKRQLIVNEISDIHKVEANIYKKDGGLLATSEPDLFEKDILAPLMDRRAFELMEEEGRSQYIGEEQILNLKFLSAYLPILSDKREIVAYLNLPYFSRQGRLQKELSTYTITFVNVYFFLFLLAIGLAYLVSQRITRPLQLIRDRMSLAGLDHPNELIEWHQQDEIGRLVKQYNKMLLQLEDSAQKLSESEREGAWKEMARQVAHEIKNPLTPMKLNIQHLQRAWASKSDKLDQTIERVSRVMIEQIDSLTKLADEFSSFAKMPVNRIEKCDLNEIILNTIHLFEKSEHVRFVYSDTWSKSTVLADKDQLGRVFNNIIKNAIQAIQEGEQGVIEVKVEHKAERVRVSIKDNGRGIPKEQYDKIFVPNFSTKNSGMGLGMAITRKIVEAAEGKIWFESQLGVGTTFFVELPLSK